MKFEEAMTLKRQYVQDDFPLGHTAAAMVAARCTFLPVLKGNVPVGVVTRKDLLDRSVGWDVCRTPVSRIMSRNPTCMSFGADVDEIAETMLLYKFRNLVVTLGDGTMLGVANSERIRPHVKDPVLAKALLRLSCDAAAGPPSAFLFGNFQL